MPEDKEEEKFLRHTKTSIYVERIQIRQIKLEHEIKVIFNEKII